MTKHEYVIQPLRGKYQVSHTMAQYIFVILYRYFMRNNLRSVRLCIKARMTKIENLKDKHEYENSRKVARFSVLVLTNSVATENDSFM